MKKALIYTRVSTDEQAGNEKHSLATQQRLCNEAIKSSGEYSLAENGLYSDPGRSGQNMKRPGLQDLLIRIGDDNRIKAVFVQDTDRLARNANDHLTIRAILHKHGVTLVSVSQPGIENTPEGNFMDLVIAGVNQLQSQITARKTDNSLNQKFSEGGWPTKAPMGYKNAGDPNDPKVRIVVQDQVRAPFIAEMFRMYSTGDYSAAEINDLLYKKGFVTEAGKKVALSKVFEALTNHFYYGSMHWKGKVRVGNHEPLITKEVFDRCQKLLQFNNKYACRRRKHDFLLRGFAFCASCKHRMTAGKVLKKDKSYYHCTLRSTSHCQEKYTEVDCLEMQVQKLFSDIKFSPDLTNKIVAQVQALYTSQRDIIDKEKKALQTAKANHEHKREVAEEKLIAGVINDLSYSRIVSKIDEQIEILEREEYRIDQKRKVKINVVREVLRLVGDIGTTYKDADPKLKRLYIGLFWQEFQVADKSIVHAQKAPILMALEAIGSVSFGKSIRSPFQEPGSSLDPKLVQLSSSLGDVVEDVRTVFERKNDASIYIPGFTA